MKDFEQLISPFVEKVVNKDNHVIVSYRVTRQARKEFITVRDLRTLNHKLLRSLPPNCTKLADGPKTVRRIKTPEGIFADVPTAAAHHNVSRATVRYRCMHWTEHEFYFYTGAV